MMRICTFKISNIPSAMKITDSWRIQGKNERTRWKIMVGVIAFRVKCRNKSFVRMSSDVSSDSVTVFALYLPPQMFGGKANNFLF